jgi:anti-sigma regulatory factor (Ser/Thr protein kinase)
VNERADTIRTPISLVIPRKAEYISLCRLVAGVVGARDMLDEEVIADLKLAVSEACTCFLWGPEGGPLGSDDGAPEKPLSLRVDFAISPAAWEITISDPDGAHRLTPLAAQTPMSEEALGLTIITALVDSIEQIESDGGSSQLRLVKLLRPQPVVNV